MVMMEISLTIKNKTLIIKEFLQEFYIKMENGEQNEAEKIFTKYS